MDGENGRGEWTGGLQIRMDGVDGGETKITGKILYCTWFELPLQAEIGNPWENGQHFE